MCRTMNIGLRVTLASVFILCVNADIYLHNPRGSNNRLNENGRDRKNANRLFDSQNNNRGGYNVGNLHYYTGSKLPIEWTNQHSCNSPNSHCELIIQYMCGDLVRDGAKTDTIPLKNTDCADSNCDTDVAYGLHEDNLYYTSCRQRQRNKGLYTADQKMRRRETAIYTRQNNNGKRRGYECPEERDYYPYWQPSPWKDIAVMTNDATRCPYYQSESENVKGRWICSIPKDTILANADKGLIIPNNKRDCENFRWPRNDPNGVRGTWVQTAPHGIPTPTCQETEITRDNHLGNGLSGYPNLFNWTIPDIVRENCVLRMRYNISTFDYDAWNTSAKQNVGEENEIDLSQRYGFNSRQAAKGRGYEFINNPQVQLFEGTTFKLRLAINTAQYGRTFQDRSHRFSIRKRPEDLKDKTIHNVNVRGKRGNIVQVYPAVEYDFVPNTLKMTVNDYVHFQWTGSNTNPRNNDGQGTLGTDRSNVILQRPRTYLEGRATSLSGGSEVFGHWGRSYPSVIQNSTFLGFSAEEMLSLALLTPNQSPGPELDAAGTYFNLRPSKVTQTGTAHYMGTRNNNFSNRSQKGKIVVVNQGITEQSIGWNGGSLTLESGNAGLLVARGTLNGLHLFRIEEWKPEDGERLIHAENKQPPYGDGYASNYIMVHPSAPFSSNGKTIDVEIKLNSGSSNPAVFHSSGPGFSTWVRVDAQIRDNVASFSTAEGGMFVVRRSSTNPGMIAGIVLTLLALVLITVVIVVYVRRNPDKMGDMRSDFRKAKRSLTQNV